MSVQTMLQEAESLTVEERIQLVKGLVDMLTPSSTPPKRKRSLHEFKGIGAHAYDGTDAQEYVNHMRSEWDDRP